MIKLVKVLIEDIGMFFGYSNNRKKPVVFISSALSPDGQPDKVFEFFIIIVAKLSIEFRKNGFEIILKVPSNQHSATNDQNIFLKDLSAEHNLKKYYSGVILAPFTTCSSTIKSLADLISYNKKLPVITIDKKFETKDFRREVDSDPPPYVVCNAEQGGSEAARSLIHFYLHNKLKCNYKFEIIIMKGLEGSKERIDGFEAKIEDMKIQRPGFPGHIFKTLKGDFSRDKTKTVIKANFGEIVEKKINAFFCCNDEMALGVRDVIVENLLPLIDKKKKLEIDMEKLTDEYDDVCNMPESDTKESEKKRLILELREINNSINILDEKITVINNIKIVGFDGILEVQLLVKNNDRWLLNSVDVQITQQVNNLIKIFNHLLKNNKIDDPKLMEPVPIKLIKKVRDQKYV